MDSLPSDATFTGAIPEIYDRWLVPMIFAGAADDLARRVAALGPSGVVETAAGTGVLTRALARALPAQVAIDATDLNPAMLAHAAAVGTARPVRWQPADAGRLPFADGHADVVACQFGVMFFPDKRAAFAEARRVLRDGGTFLFSVWDRIEENAFAAVVEAALGGVFPADPPRFIGRTPHGCFDLAAIAADLAGAGFGATPQFDTVAARSRAGSAAQAAAAYCQGTPLRGEIERRGGPSLAEATAVVAAALAARFGHGEIDGPIRSHVIAVRR